MRWQQWKRQLRSLFSIADPQLAAYFRAGPPNYSGVEIGEDSAMALSAVWRAVSLISGSLAMLPLVTQRDLGNGLSEIVKSPLDEPGGPMGPTALEWKETVLAHLLLHGDAFLAHMYNGAGGLASLVPVHPLCVGVRWVRPDEQPRPGGKIYTATLIDGTNTEFDASTMTQISALSLDGLRGLSVVSQARNSLGCAVAGDRAAARMFSEGALISGMVTPEDDAYESDDIKVIKADLQQHMLGWENASTISVINRRLKFTPWTMNAVDAQFLESRQFSIEEIARWFGVPPFELMQTEKQTSWGTGIEAQQRGLSRQVLGPWATRFEQRLSRLVPRGQTVRFDFSDRDRPIPEIEIDLIIKQVQAGLLTVPEARTMLHRGPLPAVEPPASVQPPTGSDPNA